MKRAHVIVTDADYVFVEEAWTTRTTLSRVIRPSEQLLADLAWVLAAAERAVEIARDQGNDTAAALLGGCAARVRAAIGDV